MFTVEFLHTIRALEIDIVASRIPRGAKVLEIGAGTGWQARELHRRGIDVHAIEVPGSNYEADRVFQVAEYDGKQIPFEDATFDVVFSSNVLEHVRDLGALESEVRRVLKPAGICLHIMPTAAWRFWTTLAAFPAGVQKAAAIFRERQPPAGWLRRLRRVFINVFLALGALLHPFVQGRHGERGCLFTELWTFRPATWRRHFRRAGFEVIRDLPMGLHYTGHFVLSRRMSMEQRARLAERIGSACHLFELRPIRD